MLSLANMINDSRGLSLSKKIEFLGPFLPAPHVNKEAASNKHPRFKSAKVIYFSLKIIIARNLAK